jgi:probable F420-dependent oxidoreductase
MAPVQFGVALPGRGPLAKPATIVTLARKAEALRFASIFVTDHVVIPTGIRSTYPYSPNGQIAPDWRQGYLEPLALMGYLTGATSRVRIGTSVLIVPYRNPVVTAKMLATLDVMGGGRLILGAGVGWMREEFDAVQAPPFEARGRVTDEYIRLMRACWTQEPVEFRGAHYSLAAVSALPKPLQRGGIPIWTGGHTDAALRRAGTLADGWHPIGMRPPARLDLAEYADKVETIHRWARGAGRDPRAITLTLRVPLEIRPRTARPEAGERVRFRGTATQVVEDIRAYQALGLTHIVFDPVAQDARGYATQLARFARHVRPALERRPPR